MANKIIGNNFIQYLLLHWDEATIVVPPLWWGNWELNNKTNSKNIIGINSTENAEFGSRSIVQESEK